MVEEVQLLKVALKNRQTENRNLLLALQQVFYDKADLQNTLMVKDMIIFGQGGVKPETKTHDMYQRVQNLIKANTFVKKKELELRQEVDLLQHRITKLESENGSLEAIGKNQADRIN